MTFSATFEGLGPVLGPFWGPFGPFWTLFGLFGPFGGFGGVLAPFDQFLTGLGVFECADAKFGPVGGPCDPFVHPLAHFGTVLW